MALTRVAASGTWTTADAVAWWHRYWHAQAPGTQRPELPGRGETVAVSVEDRLALGAGQQQPVRQLNQ
jgi:hypothetical protein